MRVLWVVLAIVVWVALFAALTRYIGWATATITIEGDLSPGSRELYDVWWGRSMQYAGVLATTIVGIGIGLAVLMRRSRPGARAE